MQLDLPGGCCFALTRDAIRSFLSYDTHSAEPALSAVEGDETIKCRVGQPNDRVPIGTAPTVAGHGSAGWHTLCTVYMANTPRPHRDV
jgi:hypothetical protein